MARGDPRRARTLGEACANGDGTFNGLRLLSWLSGLSLSQVEQEAKKVQGRNKRGQAQEG
jgi:hypothetical protein